MYSSRSRQTPTNTLWVLRGAANNTDTCIHLLHTARLSQYVYCSPVTRCNPLVKNTSYANLMSKPPHARKEIACARETILAVYVFTTWVRLHHLGKIGTYWHVGISRMSPLGEHDECTHWRNIKNVPNGGEHHECPYFEKKTSRCPHWGGNITNTPLGNITNASTGGNITNAPTGEYHECPTGRKTSRMPHWGGHHECPTKKTARTPPPAEHHECPLGKTSRMPTGGTSRMPPLGKTSRMPQWGGTSQMPHWENITNAPLVEHHECRHWRTSKMPPLVKHHECPPMGVHHDCPHCF